jgi:hypothetical protein
MQMPYIRRTTSVINERRAKKQSTLPVYWAAFVGSGDWR